MADSRFIYQVQVQYEKGNNPMPDVHLFDTALEAHNALANMLAGVNSQFQHRGLIVYYSFTRMNR